MTKAEDMMIARRADTKARADFATWKMMAKLNGTDSLSAEAQAFIASYKLLLDRMTEAEATDATIKLVYKKYYEGMGGVGALPEVPTGNSAEPISDNVTAFKRPRVEQRQKPRSSGAPPQSRLPVALIFVCLVVVYGGFRYFFR